MPAISQAMVVNAARDTGGNGGRKLVRLNNGTQFAAVKTTTSWHIYKSTDNWATPGVLFKETTAYASFQDICLATDGVLLYSLLTISNTLAVVTPYTEAGGVIGSGYVLDTGLTGVGTATLEIKGVAIHAAYECKTTAYPNSFNIRYAKGIIQPNGSVVWSATEQLTNFNFAESNFLTPSIAMYNDVPIILAIRNQYTGDSMVIAIMKGFQANSFNGWGWNAFYQPGNYLQVSPSAMFVPKSINGLANGRIWVTWHGRDASSSAEHIRVSFSDNGGENWVTVKVTTEGIWARFGSITALKNGEVCIMYHTLEIATSVIGIARYNGSTWDVMTYAGDGYSSPSALYDLDLDIQNPLFIAKTINTVRFTGTWTITNISVPAGEIGIKKDRSALLTYNVTTDGTMGTITEKVNGRLIRTITPAQNGLAYTVALSQVEWDAVNFGKFGSLGTRNTLEIEMNGNKWTYTFSKQLAATADLGESVKAATDLNGIVLPAVQKRLGNAIVAKGGPSYPQPTWEQVEAGILAIDKGVLFERIEYGNITSGTNTVLPMVFSAAVNSILVIGYGDAGLTGTPNLYSMGTSKRSNGTWTTGSADRIYNNGSTGSFIVGAGPTVYGVHAIGFKL